MSNPPPAAMTCRILHVDDDEDLLAVASHVLRNDARFEVRSTSSPSQALEAMSTFRPHLVFLDIAMPGMDGRELLGKLSVLPAAAGVPVVFVSDSCTPEVRAQVLAEGARECYRKPFRPRGWAEIARLAWHEFVPGARACEAP